MKAKRSKLLPMVVRDPNDTEKRAIAAAKQAIAEMPPRFEIGTRIKTENGATQIIQGPRHSDMEGWRAQLMAAFGTTSETVAHVETWQHLRYRLSGRSNGALLAFVWVSHRRWL